MSQISLKLLFEKSMFPNFMFQLNFSKFKEIENSERKSVFGFNYIFDFK